MQDRLPQLLNLWFLIYAAAAIIQVFAATDQQAAELDSATAVTHAIVLAAFVMVRCTHRELRPSLALSLLCVVACLMVIDLYFYTERRSIGGHRPDPLRQDKLVQDLKSRRAAGEDVVLAMIPSNFFAGPQPVMDGQPVLPLAGVSRTQTLFCDELGFIAEYRADRFGLSNPDGVWDEPGRGLLLLGDSFVHGACVRPEDSIAGAIRRTQAKTINAGMNGAGPLTQLAMLREFGPRATPAAVIWFYYHGNDLTDLATERRQPVLMRYLADKAFRQDLPSRTDGLDRFLRAVLDSYVVKRDLESTSSRPPTGDGGAFPVLRGIAKRIVFSDIGEIFRLRRADPGTTKPDALFGEALAAARDEACRLGSRLVFVFLPDTRALSWGRETPVKGEIFSFVRRHNLGVIDAEAAMLRDKEPRSLIIGHFTPRGNSIVAQSVVEGLPRALRESACP